MEKKEIESRLKNSCQDTLGVVDSNFLCQSVGALNPKEPLTILGDATVLEAVTIMKAKKIGCLVIKSTSGGVSGIFTERDVLLKGFGADTETRINTIMTKNPMTIGIHDPIAYALNLMSHGGFRHLPVVDDEETVVGIISVKDIVDYLVAKMTAELMSV